MTCDACAEPNRRVGQRQQLVQLILSSHLRCNFRRPAPILPTSAGPPCVLPHSVIICRPAAHRRRVVERRHLWLVGRDETADFCIVELSNVRCVLQPLQCPSLPGAWWFYCNLQANQQGTRTGAWTPAASFVQLTSATPPLQKNELAVLIDAAATGTRLQTTWSCWCAGFSFPPSRPSCACTVDTATRSCGTIPLGLWMQSSRRPFVCATACCPTLTPVSCACTRSSGPCSAPCRSTSPPTSIVRSLRTSSCTAPPSFNIKL